MSKYRLLHYINDNVFYIPSRTIEYDVFIKKNSVSTSELEIFDEEKKEYVKFDSEKFDDPIWYNENLSKNRDELNTMAQELSDMNNMDEVFS